MAGGVLFEATGQDPYFHGKHGFPAVGRAKDHAYREFQREVRAGRLDPSRDEWFSYLYRFQSGGGPPVFFHTRWERATFDRAEQGSLRHRVRRPLPETEGLEVWSLLHSHPTTAREGAGPSRVDVATASRFRNADGSFRYLYLINNHGRLIQFKARREIDPADRNALGTLPVRPRLTVDWLD